MVSTPASFAHQGTARLFERLADRYDAWYDGPAGRVLFPLEVGCLAPLLRGSGRPRLEIGVGSGRFAHSLGIDFGLDPARAPLSLARQRGIMPVQGAGEALPLGDGTIAAILLVVTLCFADNPKALLAEARRVLAPGGTLLLGMVFADSPWGAWYQRKATQGHPFYSSARSLTHVNVQQMLADAGFVVRRARSTLVQPPSDTPHAEPILDGYVPEAGFVALQVA